MRKEFYSYNPKEDSLDPKETEDNISYLKILGSEIRERREMLCYTQEGFANELSIDRGYYGLIENGKTNPTFLLLKKISIYLKMDLVISQYKR